MLFAKSLPATQQFLACIRRALIGPRGPKAFQQAARVWHRRAAAVAALRNENQTDRPGWPPLCPPWTSPCGHYRIVPLTTARALVEEGNAHHHCVGTYYDACRSGGTQILSLRENGKPVVTAEIFLDRRIASIRVGQFKGLPTKCPTIRRCTRPCAIFCAIFAPAFIRSTGTNCGLTANGPTEHCFYGWSSQQLSIAHARQAFPLYLPLLPRGTPASFDLWCDKTGLRTGLRAVLNDLIRQHPKAA